MAYVLYRIHTTLLEKGLLENVNVIKECEMFDNLYLKKVRKYNVYKSQIFFTFNLLTRNS